MKNALLENKLLENALIENALIENVLLENELLMTLLKAVFKITRCGDDYMNVKRCAVIFILAVAISLSFASENLFNKMIDEMNITRSISGRVLDPVFEVAGPDMKILDKVNRTIMSDSRIKKTIQKFARYEISRTYKPLSLIYTNDKVDKILYKSVEDLNNTVIDACKNELGDEKVEILKEKMKENSPGIFEALKSGGEYYVENFYTDIRIVFASAFYIITTSVLFRAVLIVLAAAFIIMSFRKEKDRTELVKEITVTLALSLIVLYVIELIAEKAVVVFSNRFIGRTVFASGFMNRELLVLLCIAAGMAVLMTGLHFKGKSEKR